MPDMERMTTAGIAIRDGRVLVAHRVKGGSLSGRWEFPGGKNRYGESLPETLMREYEEELSIAIEVGEEVFRYDFTNGDTLYHLHAFMIRLLSDDFMLSVHTEARWVGREELSSLDMGGSDSAIRDFILLNLLPRPL